MPSKRRFRIYPKWSILLVCRASEEHKETTSSVSSSILQSMSCRHLIGHFFCMCLHVLPIITSSPFKVCYCCYINSIIKWRKQIYGLCGESNLISKWSLISFFLSHAMRHEGYLSSLTRDQNHASTEEIWNLNH